MNAREYFNKHGYKHCKSACIQNGWLNTGFWVQLKRLVESHELVKACGGIEAVNQHLKEGNVFRFEEKPLMRQTIADVESCLKVDKKLEGL